MQEFGIATESLISLRKKPSEKSELSSQILFGETYKVLQFKGEWIEIETVYDHYSGWISTNMHFAVHGDFLEFVAFEKKACTCSISLVSEIEANSPHYLPHGATLPAFSDKSMSFKIGNKTFRLYDKNSINSFTAANIKDVALRFLNAPYLWGGRTIFGIDCSGFTQIVYKICGIKLMRDAYQQFIQGEFVTDFNVIQAGNLAFFGSSISKITHVGILLSKDKIIHASGRVKISAWDEIGIYDEEQDKYTHKLVGIKKIVN